MSEEPPKIDKQINPPAVTDFTIYPGMEGYVEDPAKAEVMAYAEKPHREDAINLVEIKQHALNVLGELNEEYYSGNFGSGSKEQTLHLEELGKQRDQVSRLESSERRSIHLAKRAATKAAQQYDDEQPASEVHAEDELDRPRLRELTAQALERGAKFGRQVELTDSDREQLKHVISKVTAQLEPAYQDPDWQAFMKLVDEGKAKGKLLSMDSHRGSAVPTWCIDGGSDPAIKKVLYGDGGDRNGIQVPSNIFNLLHWQRTVARLEDYANRSNKSLHGANTKVLGEALQNLAFFVNTQNEDSVAS